MAQVQVEVLETRYENDTIYCHFNLKETLTVRNFTCDLNVPYHLLLATGPSVVAHNIRQHTFVDISYEKIDLDSVAREEREAADVSVYDGCGVSKGCFGSPDGCVEAMDCDMITTYVRNESDFTFEIFGRNKPNLTNFYTAVGFSDDKRMGNDCVVECVLYRSEVKTFMSLNEGEENRRDANVKVDELEARYENDTVYCRFKLVERVTVKNFTCDLSVPQYVFLATGPALVAHNIRQHTHEEVSLEKIDFSVVAPDEEVADVYDGCGVSKGCFGAPRGCVDDKNCFMMTTYLRNGADYTFEIFGQNKHNMTNFYTAVGFSGDNRRMGNDCVVECVLYNSQLKTFVSSNEGEGNKRDPNVTVDVLATRYEQDAIYCQFKLKDMVVARNLSCDLNVAQYLLMATGRAFPQHTIHGHENDIASAEKIQLDEFGTSQEVTDVYEGCGVSKGCYGTPDGCVTGRTCDMMATYVRNESDYIFEIFGANAEKSDNFYTALGFSGDNRKMGDDCIVECVLYGDQVKAFASLNEGTDNARDPDMKVHLLGSRYENDTIYCQFKLDEVLTVNSFKCNLTVAQYLLLATGRSSSGHEINKHSKEKASADKIDLNFVGIDDGSFDDILMRLHGSFMVVAWLVFAPIGVISARYYKPKLKENVCGKDLWFTVHRTSMVLTWLLTLVAFVLIFIEVSGWSSHTAHAVIGCIATFLVFVQPIMAAFRPMPKAPNRPLFNWSHFLVGNSAHILAITCLFLALDITHVGASDWTLYLLIAFVIVYCCVHAAMTVTDRVASKRQAKTDAEKTSKPKKYKNWKKSLILFSMFAAGIAIAVIVGITSQ